MKFLDTNQMKVMESEEKSLREKNLNLQRKLQMEIERREALHRHLSESESSLEMDEER
jgi:coiled-coil domain-containing protein 6